MKRVLWAASLLLTGSIVYADIIPSHAATPSLTAQGTKIDASSTGNETEQGNIARTVAPLSLSAGLQQVPEPATFTLLGTGLIGVGFLRRLRRRKA